MLDSKGRLRWKSTKITNVRSVCAGDVLGAGTLQVVATENEGKVYILGSDGTERKELDTGHHASMVLVGKLTDNDDKATIFVDGIDTDGTTFLQFVSALSADGTKKWTLKLPTGKPYPGAASGMLASAKPWLAMGTHSGHVYVIDAEHGEVIASVTRNGAIPPEVAWVTSKADGKPLLLVANGGKLRAFRVIEAK